MKILNDKMQVVKMQTCTMP